MTTTYARATAFVDQCEDDTIGSYTIGKEYPLYDGPPWCGGSDFTIIDDNGDPVPCWWDGSDPDVIWERIER